MTDVLTPGALGSMLMTSSPCVNEREDMKVCASIGLFDDLEYGGITFMSGIDH